MRNVGEHTMIELEELCKAQGIELRSVQNIKENLAPYQLPFRPIHYEGLYKYKIATFDELNKLTTFDLNMICQQNYTDTMKMYFVLRIRELFFKSGKISICLRLCQEKMPRHWTGDTAYILSHSYAPALKYLLLVCLRLFCLV